MEGRHHPPAALDPASQRLLRHDALVGLLGTVSGLVRWARQARSLGLQDHAAAAGVCLALAAQWVLPATSPKLYARHRVGVISLIK